jgi:hypothetical protein
MFFLFSTSKGLGTFVRIPIVHFDFTDNPNEWTIDQVCHWAKDNKELGEKRAEIADILAKKWVTGKVLLTLTKEELTSPLYNMPLGAAIRLSMAIEKLKYVVD